VNHFFLWVSQDTGKIAFGAALLNHFKSPGPVSRLAGKGWSLCHAAQNDGLGAYADNRIHLLKTEQGGKHLLWFGHAWSKSDGARPPFSILNQCADDTTNIRLIEMAREKTNGVFALILIDDTKGEVVVCADAIGSFQVYHRSFADGVAISNSSALLAALPPRSSLDPLGAQELCSNAVANEDRTTWQDVSKLRAAHLLEVDCSHPKASLIPHRPLLNTLDGITGYQADPLPALFNAMSDVLVTLQSHGGRGAEFRDLPWVADLTGGNDSRALVAAIVANHIKVASTVSGSPNDPDVRIGEHLAKMLGIPHFTRGEPSPVSSTQFFEALRLTDGEYDAIEYAGVAEVHHQHIRNGLQFSLNGSYGELGRGHAWRLGLTGMLFPDSVAATLTRRGPLLLDHPSVARWNQMFTLKNPEGLFSPPAYASTTDYFPGMFRRLLSYAGHLPWHAQLDLIHADLRMERWQGRLLSNTGQIWPAVSPWGFQEPLTQVLTASPTIRRNGLLTRAFTLAYAPVLAQEPLYTGNPAMPFSVKNAHRFLPLIPYFAGRATQKIQSRFLSGNKPAAPSALQRQPLLCTKREIMNWMSEPLLAETGLFDLDMLLLAMSPDQPQSERMHQLWRRLITLEGALRQQAEVNHLNLKH
jgi:hypothetical protein